MVLTASLGYGCASLQTHSLVPALPVPAFANPESTHAEPRLAQRTTLLLTDCADALVGSVDASALLGQPAGSISVHTARGISSPSVGVLERLSCRYQRPERKKPPVLLLNLTAFTDPRVALEQRARNIDAEDTDTLSAHLVPLGSARADLINQGPRVLLMVAWDRYTITATLARGVIADNLIEPTLVDLVQRVLPNLPSPTERTHSTSR